MVDVLPVIVPPTKENNKMFKVGDRVRITIGKHKGLTGRIVKDADTEAPRVELDKNVSGHNCRGLAKDGHGRYFGTNEIELVSTKGKRGRPAKVKEPIVKFLLKYDLDEDPVEEFESMQQVNKRIKELLKQSDLKRDSMVVYSIKSKKKVTIEDRVVIK